MLLLVGMRFSSGPLYCPTYNVELDNLFSRILPSQHCGAEGSQPPGGVVGREGVISTLDPTLSSAILLGWALVDEKPVAPHRPDQNGETSALQTTPAYRMA
jgi:hypothetical protein